MSPFSQFCGGGSGHVVNSLNTLVKESSILRRLIDQGQVGAIGAMYDVTTGECEFLLDDAIGISTGSLP